MQELVRNIVRALVDSPEEVDIREIEGPKSRILELKFSKKDVGKVIGRERRNIGALRRIVTAASKGKKSYVIVVINEDRFASRQQFSNRLRVPHGHLRRYDTPIISS